MPTSKLPVSKARTLVDVAVIASGSTGPPAIRSRSYRPAIRSLTRVAFDKSKLASSISVDGYLSLVQRRLEARRFVPVPNAVGELA